MNKREIADQLKCLDEVPIPDKEKMLSACPQPIGTRGEVFTVNQRNLKFKPLIAVCTALLLLFLGVSTYAVAAENKEYKEAVMFFDDYDLLVDGLSRGDIKKVYRDIQTGTFTYSKTADVIEKSITSSTVSGQELFQDDPTPEELANIWKSNYGHNHLSNLIYDENNVAYRHYLKEKVDQFGIHDKSILDKYIGDKLVWTAEFSDWIDGHVIINDNVLVYGTSSVNLSTHRRYAWMALIESDGKVLWRRMLDNGFKDEYIGAVVPDDNKIVVFSRGDLNYLCFNEFDLNGDRMNFNKTSAGNTGIWNAAKLGDDYIVQLGSNVEGESALIVKVSSEGRITDSFSYESEDSYYYITDMIEYNNLIYLSAYSVPALEDKGKHAGGRRDIAKILYYIFDNELYDITDEELTKLMRENFTAVLLVCDPSSGTPKEFFSVKSSLGGNLKVGEANNLIWGVQNISDSHFSPATSAFSIAGASYVYKYTFDENGVVLSQEKTGDIEKFFR